MNRMPPLEKIIQQHILNIKREKKVVYRYLPEPEFADQFAKGEFRISTLEACRKHDNVEQGDKEEAKEDYRVSKMTSADPNFYKKAKQAGFHIGNAFGCVMINCVGTKAIPNGFVLCTTNRRDDHKFCKDFGNYCVKINDADLFFKIVSQNIMREYALIRADHKGVTYDKQTYEDDELPPGEIGFVKRKIYSWQEEHRFLWLPKNYSQLMPTNLYIPELEGICERVL